jgi:hypothetical protein
MIENIHQRPILISKREGGIFSRKRSQGEHSETKIGGESYSELSNTIRWEDEIRACSTARDVFASDAAVQRGEVVASA